MRKNNNTSGVYFFVRYVVIANISGKFCKSMTERKEKSEETFSCKKCRKKKIWMCKSLIFFSYKLKSHIEVYVELPKNPSSQASQDLDFELDCPSSLNLRKRKTKEKLNRFRGLNSV